MDDVYVRGCVRGDAPRQSTKANTPLHSPGTIRREPSGVKVSLLKKDEALSSRNILSCLTF